MDLNAQKLIRPTIDIPFQKKFVQSNNSEIKPDETLNKSITQNSKPKIEIVKGSIYGVLRNYQLKFEDCLKEIPMWLGLTENHQFRFKSVKTDSLGITHTYLQQYYKNILVDGMLIILNSKNGIVNTINGQFNSFENLDLSVLIDSTEAMDMAKDNQNATALINEYPIELLIIQLPKNDQLITKLAYKVRIDANSPLRMNYVFVDAKTGEVINTINLIAHADVSGTAQTLYSGNQPITCDAYSSQYRLRENGRKIETYDATNSTELTTQGYANSADYVSKSTTWTGVPKLTSFTISAVSQNWWYTAFADEKPDLYIKIKDGNNNTVYTSNYYINLFPSLTFSNLNIYLDNPPYKAEIWDYDAGNSDDFGGSYTLTSSVGTQNWSGNNNNGNYIISTGGHPALDVHWGMEKSYDFYLNVFNRKSFDGNGSTIKQYLNPPDLQNRYGNSPNNAFAYGKGYNIMAYGIGDGVDFGPVVGLDVEGHEFTHLVVDNNGNGGLVYQGESGALNESFADIFGTCIEFYSGVNTDWNIGEDVSIKQPYLRSMSNPKSSQNPNTYGGSYWVDPSNLDYDKGGVHFNSGVQNYWFYLLCQGGNGTNDKGNSYNVNGIGISQARQIAYRNLVTYLGPNATYWDSYIGSLLAAEDLYGFNSNQYMAVRKAWYAVGIGTDPDYFCKGITTITAANGTITDGSGSENYKNNTECKWVIKPAGATQIQLTFKSFDTEFDYDTVFVYDGPDDTYKKLAIWWGNTLPPVLYTSTGVGAMCIKFKSDILETATGWSADFQAFGSPPSCTGATVLSSVSGSFTDGSGSNNYGNNHQCLWYIAPPCANTVTLSFSQFATELNYDGIVVYDGWDNSAKQIAVLTGSVIPNSVTSNTGKMLVYFISDYSTVDQGFSANYSSTGTGFCTSGPNLITNDYGIITDGSGSSNYCNNQDCSWLIKPDQATSITLNFEEFDLEETSSDGKTIYDAVEVYDGSTTSSKLLGRFTGNSLPPTISTSGGAMLVRFYSDLEVNLTGFKASYTSTQNSFCSGTTTTLTAINGSFSDGSSTNKYANNTSCSWLIDPPNASTITLSFTAFNTESDNDGVIVYDGKDNSAPLIGKYSGQGIPAPVTSTGGKMLIEFFTDPALREDGWNANYTSTIATGIGRSLIMPNIKLYPNPTNGLFNVQSEFKENAALDILDVLGKQVLKTFEINKGSNQIDASDLNKGVYLIKFKFGNSYQIKRLVIY
jgi:Zn-dependent metalloprotease